MTHAPILLYPGGRGLAPAPPPPPPRVLDASTGLVWKGSPHFWRGRPHDPIVLMVHTMGGSLAGTDSWFNSPDSEVSAHFGCGLLGQRHQYVRLEDQAWVNGVLERGNRWREVLAAVDVPYDDESVDDLARLGPNALTVGIETEDLRNPDQPVTDALFDAVEDLSRLAMERYPSIRVLSSHHIVSPLSRANCTGARWLYGPIQRLALDLGLMLVI